MLNSRYLLLNPRYYDLMSIKNASEITAKNGLYVIKQPHLKQPDNWALRLIDLQQRVDIRCQMQEWIEDKNLSRDLFCGWLTTDTAPEIIKIHIEQQLVQFTPDRRRMLLRYFDPRVLDQLICILDDTQRYALMGPINKWCFLDANHHIQNIERPSFKSGQTIIRAEQWQAIFQCEEIDRIRNAWKIISKDKMLPIDHYNRITTWIKIANTYKINDMTDHTAFVLLGLYKGWRFDQTEVFNNLFSHHKKTGLPLIMLFNKMTASNWSILDQQGYQEPIDYAL